MLLPLWSPSEDDSSDEDPFLRMIWLLYFE